MLSTTFAFSGSRSPGSAGGNCRYELLASARAKEGSGDMTTVESTRRLISTIVVFPHFEHLNCTFNGRRTARLSASAPRHSECTPSAYSKISTIRSTLENARHFRAQR